MNNIEVQSKFVSELQDLLMKYKVHMDIDNCGDWGEPDNYILFWSASQYDENGNLITDPNNID